MESIQFGPFHQNEASSNYILQGSHGDAIAKLPPCGFKLREGGHFAILVP